MCGMWMPRGAAGRYARTRRGSVLRQNATWGIWAERHLGELEWVPDWIDLEVPLEVSGVQVYAAKIAANAACATSPVGCQSTTP